MKIGAVRPPERRDSDEFGVELLCNAKLETKLSRLTSWCKQYVKDMGMMMPDSNKTMIYETHANQLWDKYQVSGNPPVTYQYFCMTWKQLASEHNWFLRKPTSNFATCEKCATYQVPHAARATDTMFHMLATPFPC